MLNLQRPDRMPFSGVDIKNAEYRPDLYHLGEWSTSRGGARRQPAANAR